MSLSNASLVVAPTSISPTGGSALAFASQGSPVAGKLVLYVPADTDLRLRRTMDVTVKAPNVNAAGPNGYTQARVLVVFKKPKLLANGKITVNTMRAEIAYDPEATQTEIQELIDIGAQVFFDSDFTPTFKALSLS